MTVKRILIVDDEKTILNVLKEGFKKYEDLFKTDTASTAEDAIELIKKNKYSLVISDIRLPGKSGIDVLIELRKNQPDAGFIAMTAFSNPEVEEKVKNFGALKYIEKPFSLATLRKIVLNFLNEEETGVRGIVESINVTSILQLMNMEKKTCVLWIELDGKRGYIAFEEGEIVDAKFGSLKGLDAAKFIIKRNEGEIRIDTKRRAKKRTIDQSFMNILLDSMKEKDENSKNGKDFDSLNNSENENRQPEILHKEIDLKSYKKVFFDEFNFLSDVHGFINAGIFDFDSKVLVEYFSDEDKSFNKIAPLISQLFLKSSEAINKIGFGLLNFVSINSDKGILFVSDINFGFSKGLLFLLISEKGNVGLAKNNLVIAKGKIEEFFLGLTN